MRFLLKAIDKVFTIILFEFLEQVKRKNANLCTFGINERRNPKKSFVQKCPKVDNQI